MLSVQNIRKGIVLAFVIGISLLSFDLYAGDVAVRKDGSMIYTKDDGTWVLAIPSETAIRGAVNKRDHELWTHPEVKGRLNGREPKKLSSKEAKSILDDVRESGLKKYRRQIDRMVKKVAEIVGDGAEHKRTEPTAEKHKPVEKTKRNTYETVQFKDLPSPKTFKNMTEAQEAAFEKNITHYVLVAKGKVKNAEEAGYKVTLHNDGKNVAREYKYRLEVEYAERDGFRMEYEYTLYSNDDRVADFRRGQMITVRGKVLSADLRFHEVTIELAQIGGD